MSKMAAVCKSYSTHMRCDENSARLLDKLLKNHEWRVKKL